nr:MAG TPA: hypothetical protein [Caudoviricetes sp.]
MYQTSVHMFSGIQLCYYQDSFKYYSTISIVFILIV